ncbi:tyrosine-protein kinase SRK2-like isoform X2 [Bolinopsis microptera]|uniref:tyrosine-protein kinase SRK2-like isoform X1 n=1 Tax=Bolinopsis microptera TaxID=2820187 RepID=UPI003079EC82
MGNCCCKGAKEDISTKAVVYSVDPPSQPAQDVTPLNPYVHQPPPSASKAVPNHYVALYDYETAVDSLPFRKFDEFQIIDFTTTDWFLARKLTDNTEGFVPASYIAEFGSLKTYPWYFEVLSRKDAGVMLNKSVDGSYLVRPSETKPGCFSLSVKVPEMSKQTDDPNKKPNSIKHYIIRHSKENNTFFIRQQMPFKSIAELLEFFKSNKDQLGYQLTEAAKPLSSLPDLVVKTWEIDPKDIQLGAELGHGAFGMVYRGTLKGQTQVAIKTFKPGTMDTEAFLEEADLMKKLRHKNILSLLAIQTKAEPIMIITELMGNGALLDYVRKPATKQILKVKDQIDMAAQCADGMAYLEISGFIHRDLAARNVLVNESRQCKIADFGLSKLDEEYTASNTTRFPVKWTAPEAALYGNYSIKSDVWSFGVLLYEIITFGRVPYPGKNNKEVLDMLETEARMEKPNNCPDAYYGLMMTCHKQDPNDRPTFETLKFQLEDYFFGTTDREYQ